VRYCRLISEFFNAGWAKKGPFLEVYISYTR